MKTALSIAHIVLNGYKSVAIWRDDWQHGRPFRITWQVALCCDDAGMIGHAGHSPNFDCFTTLRAAKSHARTIAESYGLAYKGLTA